MHIRLMETLLAQKNWRNKLTLLQNIEKRLELSEEVEILLPKLLQQLGDKIAVVRSGIVKLGARIISQRKVALRQVAMELKYSLNSKNWFERQAVLLLLHEVGKDYDSLLRTDQATIREAVKQGLKDRVANIREVASDIREGIKMDLTE